MGYAGIHCYPPIFIAYFDEAAGTFSGIREEVEHGMPSLPEVITRSRWENAFYRHPFFGRRKLAEPFFASSISRLGAAIVGGRKVPLELYMSRRRMSAFEPEQLDLFAPLAERLDALDAAVRADFPAQECEDWLAVRYAPQNYAQLRRALDSLFPGAVAAEQVSRPSFVAALTLRRAWFSLSPEDSGGAALTMDYHILPRRLDDYPFAAKFAADGSLMEVVVES